MTTTAAPTGNLEITVSRAELLRELTAAQSRGRAQDDHPDPVELPLRGGGRHS